MLGHGKHAWPLSTIRTLSDTLLELASGRSKGPAYEVRWLNLIGLCTRPGFGSALDDWRVSELRKIYAAGLAFPRETQNQVEWLVLWQRVSAGFTAGQQRELAQRVSGQLGLGQRKPPRVNPQIDRESWRLLASLERLDGGQRAQLGDELIARIVREPRNASWLWAIGRLGARQPLYGPLNGVVSPAVAERWIAGAAAVEGAHRRRGARRSRRSAHEPTMPARDVSESIAAAAAARLVGAGWTSAGEKLTAVVATTSVGSGPRVRRGVARGPEPRNGTVRTGQEMPAAPSTRRTTATTVVRNHRLLDERYAPRARRRAPCPPPSPMRSAPRPGSLVRGSCLSGRTTSVP